MGDLMEIIFERRSSKYVYVVPEGLRELTSDFTREVLRSQPKQLYTFIADYLDCLFVTRENAKVATYFIENVTETGESIVDIMDRTNLSLKQASRAARIIQRAFKRFLKMKKGKKEDEPIDPRVVICKMVARLEISYETANCAAITIQRSWRNYQHQVNKWKKRFRTAVDWRAAARYTLHLYKQSTTLWEAEKAATTIKAAYKGYYTRKILKQMSTTSTPISEDDILSYLKKQYKYPPCEEESSAASSRTIEVMYDVKYEDKHKAAVVIQTAFRKHLLIRKMKQFGKSFRGMSRKEYFRDYWNFDIEMDK